MLQVAPPLQRLHEQAMQAPLQYAPVLAMLIRNHQHHIPHSAYTGWLQAVHKHSFEDGSEPAGTLWQLRYLHELALAWPAALAAPEADADSAVDVSLSQLGSWWKVQGPSHAWTDATDPICLHAKYQLTHMSAVDISVSQLEKLVEGAGCVTRADNWMCTCLHAQCFHLQPSAGTASLNNACSALHWTARRAMMSKQHAAGPQPVR